MSTHALPGPSKHWRVSTNTVLALVIAVLLVSGLIAVPQLRSIVTHIGGSPRATWPLAPPEATAVARVAVAGDVGYAGGREEATVAAIERAAVARPYDALMLLGDNVYPDGNPERLDATVFGPFKELLDAGVRLLPILGNHDVMNNNADAQVERLGMPARWYSDRIGNEVLFIALDSTDLSDKQIEWLESTLAAATEPWRIIAVHHPPYSAGYQGSSMTVRRRVSPIAERYGVQLVLSGHEHDYQRSVPINGVTYVVSGAASSTRRTGTEDFTVTSWSWHHFLDLVVYPDRLSVRAVNQDLRVFDEVTIALEP